MEDYNKKRYPAYPPEPPETKGKLDFLPLPLLIFIYIILLIPIIPILIGAYLVSMPIERIVFYASGYSKLYPKYHWLLTRSTHYKMFRRYSKSYFAYNQNFNGKVIYIFEKEDALNFVLCDFDGMYYCEQADDWIIKGGHAAIGFAAFYAMEQYANEQYPNRNKLYFICLSKTDIKRGMKEKDARFLEIDDVENLIRRDVK
jgi:hypothetical protein